MSWMKRRTSGAPSPAPTPPVQMYNPSQHSNVQENQWQQRQQPQNWYNPIQQQPIPTQQQQQQQQPQGNYWQQNFSNRAPTPLQQNVPPSQNTQQTAAPPKNTPQNAPQNVYNQNTGQYGAQQRTYNFDNNRGYEQQQQVYNNSQYNNRPQFNQTETDSWGTWGWGDEDNNVTHQRQEPDNAAVISNPVDIADSFAKDQSWNWSLEDQKNQGAPPADQQSSESGEVFTKMKPPPQQKQLARAKLETPQWSTESQISQESSDDVLHTSESDKSRVLSQSSTSPSGAEPPMPPMPNAQHRLQNVLAPPLNNQMTVENIESLNGTLQTPSVESNSNLTPPMGVPVPPPVFAPPPLGGGPDDPANPYKRMMGVGHRSANKFRQAVPTPGQSVAATVSPFSVVPTSLSAGSESARPDSKEAPINDRNQYLETGQLSESSEYQRENSGGDLLPPPGFHRMIPGEIGQTDDTTDIRMPREEPPPGLSRMVLGQNEASAIVTTAIPFQDVNSAPQEPPAGLRRMVPGESSPPGSSLCLLEESDPELAQLNSSQPPRSATIGADTPPTVQVDDDIPNNLHSNSRGRQRVAEGQPQETEVDNLAGSIRNLTVGENLTDGQTSNTSVPVASSRRHSVQESSDSEPEQNKKPPKGPSKDRRSTERSSKVREKDGREKRRERERGRDRDSPDDYRDRKDRSRRYREKRYEDDTDYYSDKEKDRRVGDDRERDYDRKYSSLKKEKDRRRRGDRTERERDYHRDSRRDYYYDDYEHDNRSRPSSRSDSVHDSYRERRHEKDHRDGRRPPRDRDRDRERYNRPRDAFNPYQGVAYDPYNPYYQQYQYYENLRRTNPQAYAEWYRKYYQQATAAAGTAASYAGEDRASVHSGRSSANDELAKDRYTRHSFYSQGSINNVAGYYGDVTRPSGHYSLDTSSYSRFDQTDTSIVYPQPTQASQQRLTPAKFATAHLMASITRGKLVKVLPSFPLDGEEATLEISALGDLLTDDKEFKELNSFPGPLVRGVTHKKTIIEYCESKIREAAYKKIADVDSYVLMWELMILLIRQNGMVVGTDIAELLLKDNKPTRPEILQRPASVGSNLSSNAEETLDRQNNENLNTGSIQSVLREDEVINKFREYLLYGSGKEALEWAMRNGLWGHALFLASKLDKRTYANVMMRFANGLPMNDPLQTLYQLLSGKVPAAVTCVSDERWGSWRPHLAMVLSNSGQRPELHQRSVTALGDTLRGRGCPYAAHFCYLMAQAGFGNHWDPDARLVLLGAEHEGRPPHGFAATEAVHMTEVYEYACSLNDAAFVIPEFQVYKFLLATRLADRGLLEKSLQYLEKIATYIVSNPSSVNTDFVSKVASLADQLKFYDPAVDGLDESEFGSIPETSRPDNSWLKDLKAVLEGHYLGQIRQEIKTEPVSSGPDDTPSYEPDLTLQLNQQSSSWQMEPQMQQPPIQTEQQQQQQSELLLRQQMEQQLHDTVVGSQPQQQQYAEIPSNFYQLDQQQSYWNQQQQQQQQQPHWSDQLNQFGGQEVGLQQQQNDNYRFQLSNAQIEPEEPPQEASPPEPPVPQISMPGQKRGPSSPYDEDETKQRETSAGAPKGKAQSEDDKQQQQSGGSWFGGIFSKLALKPKNQMKLPDDKNPKIVWDQDKKRWINVDEDPNDPSSNFKPPPKMSDLMPRASSAPYPQNSYGGPPGGPADVPVNRETGNATPTLRPQSNEGASVPMRTVAQPNMFKMQRGRNLKSSYVDVLNPGGVRPPAGASPPGVPSAAPPQVSFFVPAPVADPNAPTDFLTPAPAAPRPVDHQQQVSRWSSTSSLSREVASYTARSAAVAGPR